MLGTSVGASNQSEAFTISIFDFHYGINKRQQRKITVLNVLVYIIRYIFTQY